MFCPLSSGSKGNSIFLSYKKSKILIDAGGSFKNLEKRLQKIDKKISDIDAILITHEHKDHIEALKVIKGIPIVCNLETAKGIYRYLEYSLDFKIFTTDEEFEFLDFSIFPFSIPHDSLEPVGYLIKMDKIKIGICSDLGFVTSFIKENLKNCDLLYVEANHDENMVLSSRRPDRLKKRILGRQGHISNRECASLLESVLHSNLKYIYLSHLSLECNREDLASSVILEVLKKNKSSANLFIAKQEEVSEPVLF